MRDYSLWIELPLPILAKFQKLVNKLALSHNSPPFRPHVTLVTVLPREKEMLLEKSRELAKNLKPFTIEFDEVGYEDVYFRTLYVKVKPTPQIMQAFETARTLLNSPQKDFMPHMSLMYGMFPLEMKEKIIERIGDTFSDSFTVEKLTLIESHGDVDSWRTVGEFTLSK